MVLSCAIDQTPTGKPWHALQLYLATARPSVISVVTNPDLRRLGWVPKEIRDPIQNHAFQNASSKSHDRWNCIPEKRACMAKWDGFRASLVSEEWNAVDGTKSAPRTVDQQPRRRRVDETEP